jgi:hypothetical protein
VFAKLLRRALSARRELEQPKMSADETVRCFDSIESAQDFMKVLADTILDSMKDLNGDRQAALQEGEPRRAEAIGLAIYKLKTLNCHIHKSRIILNDLRTVRRLILNERQPKARAMASGGSF